MFKKVFEKLSISINNKNTLKDTIMTLVSLSPMLPGYYYIPKYLKKLEFNKFWYGLFDSDNHKNMIKNNFGYEIQ